MEGWKAIPLESIPQVPDAGPGVRWYPLQHAFGLSAFGANAFVADRAGEVLVSAHEESDSGQQELYLLVRGSAMFEVGGEEGRAEAISAVAILDPALERSAVALEAGTTLIALGGAPRADFRSTWRPEHFEDIDPLL